MRKAKVAVSSSVTVEGTIQDVQLDPPDPAYAVGSSWIATYRVNGELFSTPTSLNAEHPLVGDYVRLEYAPVKRGASIEARILSLEILQHRGGANNETASRAYEFRLRAIQAATMVVLQLPNVDKDYLVHHIESLADHFIDYATRTP